MPGLICSAQFGATYVIITATKHNLYGDNHNEKSAE